MKKKYILVCLLAACSTSNIYTLDDFDDFSDLDNLILPAEEITSIAANAEQEMMATTRSLTHGQYYNGWFDNIYEGTDLIKSPPNLGVLQLKSTLLANWYYNTDPIATRNILFYPFNLYSAYQFNEQNTFDINFFFNKTTQKYFTPTSYNIESYVNIKNANFDDILQSFSLDTQAGVLNTLDTLGNGTIEERRMGGTLGHFYTFDDWMIYAQLPVFYSERNFQYTQKEKDILQASLLFQALKGSGESSFKDFAYDHFVMDQVGLGTLQIGCTKKIHAQDNDHFSVAVGVYTQLPTEWSVRRGLIGVWFEPTDPVAPLDLSAIDPTHLITDTLNFSEKAAIKTFFLDAIHHLASNLLRAELGNVRHFTLGGNLDLYWQPRNHVYVLSKAQAQYFFAGKEDRFFMQQASNRLNNLATIVNAIPDPTNNAPEDLKAAVVNQVSAELYNRMILSVYKTDVRPGMMFNSSTSVNMPFADDKFLFVFGGNAWFKLQERLDSVAAPSDILPYLDLPAARGYFMYQLKPFISLDYKGNSTLESISLYADYTVAQRAMGKDFTAAVSVNLTF